MTLIFLVGQTNTVEFPSYPARQNRHEVPDCFSPRQPHLQPETAELSRRMNDQIAGFLDFSGFFADGATHKILDSLCWQGSDIARDADAICAIIGSPRHKDASDASAAAYLQAWKKHGSQAPAQMRGGHAVAIADAARRAVFLAVDRFAQETLCYRLDGRTLAFSDRAERCRGARRRTRRAGAVRLSLLPRHPGSAHGFPWGQPDCPQPMRC